MSKISNDIYISKLAEKLWSKPHSKASVMVGAGFSRNATVDKDSKFPLWSDLSKEFQKQLSELNNRKNTETNPLSLASEYQAAFGKNELYKTIKNLIPDNNSTPSDLHQLLLRLPWRDVFTTNYDTLLERAASNVSIRKYHVVNVIDDISSTYSPRIVKLHGGLPSYHPLIITSKDYRTYPSEFSPFVNLIQESIMENTLCLIGFSGEDPNFLNWIGWVRDNLGDHQPPIYLCGIFDFTKSREAILKERNIHVIDLSALVNEEDYSNKDQLHYDAIEYLLVRLLLSKPYNYDKPDWPKYRKNIVYENKDNDLLDTLQVESSNQLGKYNNAVRLKNDLSNLKEFEEYLEALKGEYPGWILTPDRARLNNDRNYPLAGSNYVRSVFNKVFKNIDTLKPDSGLSLLGKISWITRIEHLYLYDNYIDQCISLLINNCPFIDLKSKDYDLSYFKGNKDVKENWLSIALMALEFYRIKQNLEQFEKLNNLINETSFDKETLVLNSYQAGLFYSSRFEKNKVIEVISSWPSSRSTLSQFYKASLYLNVEELEKAKKLLLDILEQLRKDIREQENYFFYSLEGICMYLLRIIDYKSSTGSVDRFNFLDKKLSNPFTEIGNYKSCVIDQETKISMPSRKVKNFNPYSVSKTYNYGSNNLYENGFHDAFIRYLKLFDDVGIPYRIENMIVADKNILKIIGKYIPESEESWFISVLIRYGTKDTINDWFDRARIKEISDFVFNYFLKVSHEAFIRSVENLSFNNVKQANCDAYNERSLLTSSLLLSKFLIRTDEKKFNEIFNSILKFYKHPVHKRTHFFYDSLKELIRNSILPLQLYATKELLESILTIPADDKVEFEGVPDFFPKLTEYIWDLPFEILNDHEPTQIIDSIFHNLKTQEDKSSKQDLVELLIHLNKKGVLASEQEKELGQIIWKDGIENSVLRSKFNILSTNAPNEINKEVKFKDYLLKLRFKSVVTKKEVDGKIKRTKTNNSNGIVVNEFVDGVANYWNRTNIDFAINPTEEIVKYLLDVIFNYWSDEKEEIERELNTESDPMKLMGDIAKAHFLNSVILLNSIVIPNLKTPSSKVNQIIKEASEIGVELLSTQVIIALVKNDEKEILRLKEKIAGKLRSSEELKVDEGITSFYEWFRFCDYYEKIDLFPIELFKSLSLKLLYVKKPLLLKTINTINGILSARPDWVSEKEIISYLVNSLDNLYIETASINLLHRIYVSDYEKYDDTKLNTDYSYECHKLASNLLKNKIINSSQTEILHKWKNRGEESPLPEIKLVWKNHS